MSQSRVRKAPGASDVGKARTSVVKASGDTAPCHRIMEQNQRSRSKNKIPKSIRYDLENALVGLCDVWFEEIKPHLVRNNIKLHVDGASSGAGPASGDHKCLPAEASGCSHLDPGAASDRRQLANASCVGCSSTQRIASRAPFHRRPVQSPPPGPPRLPPWSPPTLPTPPDLTCQNKRTKRMSPHHLPSKFRVLPAPNYNWRVPRLCRTYSILSQTGTPRRAVRRTQTAVPTRAVQYSDHFNNFMRPRRKTTRNKWTQTDPYPLVASRIPAARQKPKSHRPTALKDKQHSITTKPAQNKMTTRKKSTTLTDKYLDRIQKPSITQNKSKAQQKPSMSKIALLTSSTRSVPPENVPKSPLNVPKSPQNRPKFSRNFQSSPYKLSSRQKPETTQTRPVSILIRPTACERCPATTAFYPAKSQKQEILCSDQKRERSRKAIYMNKQSAESFALFDKDLIDIIAEKNDKRLRVLFKSPTRDESGHSLMMNLFSSPNVSKKDENHTKKFKPWK